jgi:transcriptional regulator with XRE-family HTH domain
VTGRELKALRDRLGMTQAALAKKIKVDVMTVSRWEREVGKIPHLVEIALKAIEKESR